MEIGQVCVKIAGRDAGKKCVVVDVLDKTYVLVDGQTRRKKCNMLHLEPLGQDVELKKGSSNKDVVSALKGLGIECVEKKASAKKAEKTARPKRQHVKKEKPVKEKKELPKAAKKKIEKKEKEIKKQEKVQQEKAEETLKEEIDELKKEHHKTRAPEAKVHVTEKAHVKRESIQRRSDK